MREWSSSHYCWGKAEGSSLGDLRKQSLGVGVPSQMSQEGNRTTRSTHPESTSDETTHVSSSILIAKAEMSHPALSGVKKDRLL